MESVVGNGHVSPATTAEAYVADDNDENWDIHGTAGFENVERIGTEPFMCDFQESYRAKKHKVSGTATVAFKLATMLVHSDVLADASTSTAQSQAKNARDYWGFLQKKNNNLGADLMEWFEAVKCEGQTKYDAWRKQP